MKTKNPITIFFSVFMVALLVSPIIVSAQSPFERVIDNLIDLGFFGFVLPFLLTAAIFYGLLRKSQIFGDPASNVSINAIVAITAGFMVWAYPTISGVDVAEQLSKFFFQGAIAILGVIVSILIAGIFLPKDLPSEISKHIKSGKGVAYIVIGGLIVGMIVLLSSGVGEFLIPNLSGGPLVINPGYGSGLSSDDILTIIVVIGMMVVVGLIAKGESKN